MLRFVRKDLLDCYQHQLRERVAALKLTDETGKPVIVTDHDISTTERRGHNINKDKAKAIAEALGVSFETLWVADAHRSSFYKVRPRTDALEEQARAELKMGGE